MKPSGAACRVMLGVAVALCAMGACSSAGSSGSSSAGRPKRVVAAFYPVAEAVARVGGSTVRVDDLTPSGAEPHDLELTPDNVDAIEDADLVVVMGHGFQPAVEKAARDRSTKSIELLDALPINAGSKQVHEGDARALDPHVWLDPVLMSAIVGRVAQSLERVDPAHAAADAQRAGAFRSELAQLDAEYRAGLAHCKQDTIVTSHEAFGYLAERYGLHQEGIAGLSPDQEPDARRLADLSDLVRRKRIKVVFTEDLVSPRVANALARDAGGVKTETLSPLESLTAAQRDRNADYLSIMRDNLGKLRSALDCT